MTSSGISPSPNPLTRRAALLGLGSLAAGLTGCGAAGGQDGAPSATPAASPTSATPTPTPTPSTQLPGGGRRMFPDRRLVALYGTPGVPQLGLLGEQDLPASIDRAHALAEAYQVHADEPVQPAFEIITTMATADEGPTGDYSRPVRRDRLEEWVAGAGEAGVHVILDLQPGFADFLTQAREFEDLLSEPHVGLALDPEWRLRPGQMHMEDIGQVTAAEVNETSQWLAELVAREELPEKILMLHQFRLTMIEERPDIVDRDGLALVLHADGHGHPALKMNTWEWLLKDLPEHWWMGWKNFLDEDTPMFTPAETMAVEPRPWFVSFQ
ncbi:MULTISPECIES: hypothetical protein [Micrococcus]|uniref:Tat pathway signal sequence n=1 Tax=Micrococcus aloeverae TaxID=1391911 RepID=A0ABR6DXQ0_9MICC|nr:MULTISPECIES: hypothetical protein [Micrococcus]EZP40918.1 hypothetical protein BW36_00953 [Micrococcus luteus]MBA9081070.1 hypothetical protein [Micrococcus aloeverae]UTT46255.1 hypothetical protein NMQ02_03240 [Micrococcus luteus]WRQ43161.1 hypothetical protein SOY78_09135 [Micrococcus sp. HOU1]